MSSPEQGFLRVPLPHQITLPMPLPSSQLYFNSRDATFAGALSQKSAKDQTGGAGAPLN